MAIKGLKQLNLKLGKIGRETRLEVRRALERGSQRIQNTAAEGIIDSGSQRNPGPSLPGEFPAGKSPGGLAQRITVADASTSDVIRFETGPDVDYGAYLELGTSKMEPRPFMTPSYNENVGQVKADVAAAVRRAARKGGK